ncbi:hypothetical protein AX15_007674 [Amanita polypyramis BW_CC]|nr:hypothetical protein AX15_007674 [Amanita polypyramis BW_CC]
MQWLSRSSSQQASARYAPSKPTRISEPKLIRSIEFLSHPRIGVLGSGATVVRTPEDALRDTRVRLSPELGEASDARQGKARKSPRKRDTHLSAPQSPPLPPLPVPEEDETQFLSEPEGPPPQPSRTPPPPPSAYPEEHSPIADLAQVSEEVVLHGSRACSPEELVIPPIAFGVPPTTSPPPFQPILLSELPTGQVDPMNTIVELETSTETYKTSLNTLISQPSVLSDYIKSLFSRSRTRSNTSSIYSTTSSDVSNVAQDQSCRDPATSSPCRISVFLDRPSTPYAHILAYLRSTPSSNATPPTLPVKVQLVHNYTQERLETLLELRDEAVFLNLVDLYRLCEDELRSRQGTILFSRHYSHDSNTLGSVHSQHASVYSLHTLIERVENDVQSNLCLSNTSIAKERRPGSGDSKHDSEMQGARQIPTPESWTNSRGRSTGRQYSPPRPPPAGWI